MHCTNCGNEMDQLAAVCVNCGVSKGVGTSFCSNCGNAVNFDEDVCSHCGNIIKKEQVNYNYSNQKSKLAAGLFGIFLGTFGVHNFYLGYTTKAIFQVLLGTIGIVLCGLGPLASFIWGFIEGILILTGSITVDGNGVPLRD